VKQEYRSPRRRAISCDTCVETFWNAARKLVCHAEVNDQDYKTKFQGQSPLKQKTLIQLVDAIANGKPKAIGIDIVTDRITSLRSTDPGHAGELTNQSYKPPYRV